MEKKTAFIFADKSEAEITWKGEGLSDPEIQHLNLSADTLRIDLDDLSGEQLERSIRVWLDGAQAEELRVSWEASWLEAAFQPSGPQSGTVRIRITAGEKLRNEEHIEGKVFLSTRKDQSPAIIKVILFRKVKWRAAPDILTVSRRDVEPHKVEVVPRDGISRVVKQLKLADVPKDLDVETPAQASGSAAVWVRATSASVLGMHVLKVAVTDDRGVSSTISFLVRVVE